MELKNYYWYFKGALSKDVCNKIINLGTSTIEDDKKNNIDTNATTFGDKQKLSENSISQGERTTVDLKNVDKSKMHIRDSEIAWLTDQWLYDTIMPLVLDANNSAGWKYEFHTQEKFQFTTYHSPGGFYGWHNDMASDHHAKMKRYIHGLTDVPIRKNGLLPFGYTKDEDMVGTIRKLSVTVNLTDTNDYKGGDLKFDLGKHHSDDQFHDVLEARQQGTVIVFPSFMQHCVTPVTEGTRYSLVLWCSGRPFR
tara:strand:- start:6523 stop:7278 length:756 start_codon:yes stop_codon:yes gene_type:complete